MAVAKAAGLLVVVAGIATVTTVALVSDSGMPRWRSASDDSSENSDYTTGRYANKFKRYLVGVGTAKPNTTPADNDKWWEWSFSRRYTPNKTNSKGKFKELTKATGDGSLKAICADSYKTESANVVTTEDVADDKFQESEVWKYCSPIGQKPTLLKTDPYAYTSEAIGGTTANKDKLVSVHDDGNDLFWKIRQEEFFADSGNFSAKEENTHKFFKAFYSQKNTVTDPLALKEKCDAAYLVMSSHAGSDTIATSAGTLKYCSLEGSTQ